MRAEPNGRHLTSFAQESDMVYVPPYVPTLDLKFKNSGGAFWTSEGPAADLLFNFWQPSQLDAAPNAGVPS